MSRATLLERGSGAAVAEVFLRRDRSVSRQVDEIGHQLAGRLLLDWWILGVKWRNGRQPNFWCVGLVVGTAMVDIDLRGPFLEIMARMGARATLRHLSIDPEKRSVIERHGGIIDMAAIGREYQALQNWRGRLLVKVRGPANEVMDFDLRGALVQVLQDFDKRHRAERLRAKAAP